MHKAEDAYRDAIVLVRDNLEKVLSRIFKYINLSKIGAVNKMDLKKSEGIYQSDYDEAMFKISKDNNNLIIKRPASLGYSLILFQIKRP